MTQDIEGKALSRAVEGLEVILHLPITLQWRKIRDAGTLLELCSIWHCNSWIGHWFLCNLAAVYGIWVSRALEYLSCGLFRLDFSSMHMSSSVWIHLWINNLYLRTIYLQESKRSVVRFVLCSGLQVNQTGEQYVKVLILWQWRSKMGCWESTLEYLPAQAVGSSIFSSCWGASARSAVIPSSYPSQQVAKAWQNQLYHSSRVHWGFRSEPRNWQDVWSLGSLLYMARC